MSADILLTGGWKVASDLAKAVQDYLDDGGSDPEVLRDGLEAFDKAFVEEFGPGD